MPMQHEAVIRELSIDRDSVSIEDARILEILGYTNNEIPEPVFEALALAKTKSLELCEFRGGFRLVMEEPVLFTKDSIECLGKTFTSGRIIGSHLRRCTGLGLFVASIGRRYEEWSRSCLTNDEPVIGFVADAVASELADATADVVEAEIVRLVLERGLATTNRFSPGYCGWSVAEQHKLFSLFPANFCGISLSASALMTPIKSVSCIIGLGEHAVRRAYTCDTCDMLHCVYRRKRGEAPTRASARKKA